MSDASWLSTKALSVHNALLLADNKGAGPLSHDAIVELLKQWNETVGDEYVSLGIGYLLARKFVTETDGAFANARPGKKLRRVNQDIDLDWA